MPTVKEVIEEFLEKEQKDRTKKDYTQAQLKHILDHPAKKELRKKQKPYSLLEILETNENYNGLAQEPFSVESFHKLEDVAEHSTACTPAELENAAVSAYKAFFKYIREKYVSDLDEAELNKDFGLSQFERRIRLLQVLQGCSGSTRQSDLADMFGVSRSTIEEDLNALQSFGSEPFQIFGLPLKVEYSRKSGICSSSSTIHPIFLTLNLSQVITVLEGLYEMRNRFGYRRFSESVACLIWAQLTDYAKQRIYDCSDRLQLNKSWYQHLNDESHKDQLKGFLSEKNSIFGDQGSLMLEFAKIQKKCNVLYKDTDGKEKWCKNCRISMGTRDETFVLENSEGSVTISVNNIKIIEKVE